MSASKRARKEAELKQKKRNKQIALIVGVICVLVIAGVFTANALWKKDDGAGASEMSQTPEASNSEKADDTQAEDPPEPNVSNTEVSSDPQPEDVMEPNAEKPDLDLSKLSAMLAFSQVVGMNESPKDYVGKTVKLNGLYHAEYYEPTEQYYHFIGVGDETACCLAWLEFVWSGERAYPDDYPDEQGKIELSGIFGSYEELGNTYYYLAVDDVTKLN